MTMRLLREATHDAEVGGACDRIIRMHDGRIVPDERVTEVSAAA